VLINLVGNALKFTDQGGVTLRLDVRHGDAPEQLLLLIDVEDTGCGIAPEDLGRIFEPFVQVGDRDTQKGTGLGLTITRQFVELMGGQINVESIPGAGSKFRIAVPVGRAEDREISAAATMRGRLVGMADDQAVFRVLIVEDEIENRLLLQSLLEQAGFQVRHTSNGAAAVEAFNAWRPHFIWMDIHMPGMDGFEATRRIRELPGGKDVKIVACTASVFSNERDKCLAAGMDDIIHKPYCFDELFDCMARNLSIRFIYDVASAGPAIVPSKILHPEAIALLPLELRMELADTIVSLDGVRIAELVSRISETEPALGSILAHFAEQLNYTEIIRALQACKEIQDRETL
jgi:CheY-like chemotaxis protein